MTGLYHASITARASLNGGAGAFLWRGERETRLGSTAVTHKSKGIDPVLQLGMTYTLTPRVGLLGGLQRFFLPDGPVNRMSLGLIYSF